MKRPFEQNPDHLPPKRGEPPLHLAARLGDHDGIRERIASGDHVDLPFDLQLDPGAYPLRATPLMVAAGSGDGATVETMRLLLDLGADPARRLDWGSLARFAASGLGWNYRPGGDAQRLALCLELGADPNECDGRGVTLLADAASSGDVERVRLLLRAGAAPNGDRRVVRRSGPPEPPGSPFDREAPFPFRIPLHNAVEVDELAMVTALLDAGADVGAVDQSRRTALFSVRSAAVARRLLEAGASLEAKDCFDWSPLVAAIGDGSLEGVEALLAVGANANATHDRGFTVFMSAVSSSERRVDIMKALVAAGADPHAVSELGWNAFHAAIDVNGEANLEESVRSTLGLLAQLGVDIDHRDRHGITPLERARQMGTEIEVEALLALGAAPR